ncbi:MAG TPA: hypothetical protein PLP26_03425 [Ilumatobacteraceae bacterium]|nr:hypothetical protein [Ilumatobacteraceae bacterium]
MFKLWFAGEAGWRHNRVHLLFAAISLVLLVVSPSSGALVTALVVVGSLLLRIALWELRRTGTRLELSRVIRNQP